MKYQDVLKLPLRTFWSFNRQVDRLRAEADQRQLRLLAAAENPEAAKQLVQDLRMELDSPVVIERQFDEVKFLELQARFKNGV